jgi:hypothetical protein
MRRRTPVTDTIVLRSINQSIKQSTNQPIRLSRVARARNLCHSVDAEVAVHELHNGAVAGVTMMGGGMSGERW